MKKFQVEDLMLESLSVANASIENTSEAIDKEDNNNSTLTFGIGFYKGLNLDIEKILLKVFFKIDTVSNKDGTIGNTAKFTIAYAFHVNDLKSYVEEKKEEGESETEVKYVVDGSLSVTLLNIAYSTSRGIIFTRCLGTPMGEVVLPVVSSAKLIELADQMVLEKHTPIF